MLLITLCLGVLIFLFSSTISSKIGKFESLFGSITRFVGIAMVLYSAFNGIFFYAEPGYKYHVRTILGEEKMVAKTGYSTYLFGRYNAWKNALSVQATRQGRGKTNAETESVFLSANLRPQTLVFLDQVDASVTATARFQLPADEEAFLLLARQYRTPDNLLRTELIPAFQETLGATASLMGADEYFSGGRTGFNSEFQQQMQHGIYIVRRTEVVTTANKAAKASANAALGDQQEGYGQDEKVVFRVEKLLGQDGQPLRKKQNFSTFGISVVSARITEVLPNQRFQERMRQKQDAAAARAVAREQRIQEEEQRLLAITKGEREVAERQAQAKVIQIEQTTNAETTKQLALTEANKLKEQAEIDRETSTILLEKAKIDAEAKKVAADAEAYAKEKIIEADNALAQKLEAEVQIQQIWADAFSKRQVPQYVFGGGSDTPVGADTEVSNFMKMMTVDAAKRLNYDRGLEPAK